MGLFKKKEKKELTQYDKDKIMAKEVILRLGKKESVYDPFLSLTGGHYDNYTYTGYGFNMSVSNRNGIHIEYNGEKVLSYYYYINNNEPNVNKYYVEGTWELVLEELYNKIPIILKNIEIENKKNEHKLELLNLIRIIGIGEINNALRISGHDVYCGYEDDYYEGTEYKVFMNGELVFHGFYGSKSKSAVYTYIKGDWEDTIKQYSLYIVKKREEMKREQNNKVAEDNLYKLRLIK